MTRLKREILANVDRLHSLMDRYGLSVVARVERAMEFVPGQRITLNPDCGFSPSSANPMDFDEGYLKLSTMCQGARMLREKYPR